MIPFSREIASWTPEEFIDRVLVDGLHAAHVVVGANFRFGARAAGDVATLARVGRDEDFEAEGIALDGGPQVWSSTYVRTCLAAGDVEGAAEALGGRSRSSATSSAATSAAASSATRPPTSRRATPPLPPTGCTPGGCACSPAGSRLPVAISVGTNPTFEGERERRVESYVLDRTDLELYDLLGRGLLRRRIRGMVTFDGIDPLLDQMADDVGPAPCTLLGRWT